MSREFLIVDEPVIVRMKEGVYRFQNDQDLFVVSFIDNTVWMIEWAPNKKDIYVYAEMRLHRGSEGWGYKVQDVVRLEVDIGVCDKYATCYDHFLKELVLSE